MNKKTESHNITISGGEINAEQLSIGYKSTVKKSVNTSGKNIKGENSKEIHDLLQKLIEEISRRSGSIKNTDEALEITKAVSNELSKDKPNKLALTSVLEGFSKNMHSFTAIVNAATKLKEAIQTLL